MEFYGRSSVELPDRRASPSLPYQQGTRMKMSILIPMALALGLTAGLAPALANAACFGQGCYAYHHHAYRYSNRHWNRYSNEDYRQWREFGGDHREW
jgi:hypothetical protein